MKHNTICRGRRAGQAMTEYVILGAIIAIGGITTIWLFGNVIMYTCGTLVDSLRYTSDFDVNQNDTHIKTHQAIWGMQTDEGILRNMQNFNTDDSGGTLPALPPVPPAPVASDPLAYSGTHHLGDNWSAGTAGGGLLNEGLSYDITFTLSQDMIDYANYSSDGTLFLTFQAGDRVGDINNFIDNENVDAVLINGQIVGYAANGANTMTFDVSGLSAGQQTLTFSSGILSVYAGGREERDDFNFWNMRIGYSAP